MTVAVRPTKQQLQDAMSKAKLDGMKSSDIKHTDHGAGIVRYYLPAEFHTLPLDTIRKMCENLSRAGGEPGTRKRTPEQKIQSGIGTLLKRFPRAESHSVEYDAIHCDQEFRSIVSHMKRQLDYCCQICTRGMESFDLEGHIVDYQRWREPGFILILCRGECHPVADAMRRRGRAIESSEAEQMPLF